MTLPSANGPTYTSSTTFQQKAPLNLLAPRRPGNNHYAILPTRTDALSSLKPEPDSLSRRQVAAWAVSCKPY